MGKKPELLSPAGDWEKLQMAVLYGAETMEEKILRMIRNEGVTIDGTYGIMEVPQMSRQSERSAECA